MKSPDERMAEERWRQYLERLRAREDGNRAPPLWLLFQVAVPEA
jgi:hypothetical protein